MNQRTRFRILASAAALLSCLGGCAGSPHGETLQGTGLGSTLGEGSTAGTGYYLVENAYEAEFVNCTGQAAILEGLTFAEGYTMAPICIASGIFDVVQNGNSLSMLTHEVTCSDGNSATVTGIADFGGDSMSGAWDSASAGGVSASQTFSGTMSSNSIQILENRRSFSGAFDGECGIAPPLSASLTIL